MPRTKLQRRVGGRVVSNQAGEARIGGKVRFYRSRWERNYARYLEWLKNDPEQNIEDWDYEPRKFWFEPNKKLGLKGIRAGVTNYTPDFKVTYCDGRIEWREVKGWMDKKSQTKINRFRRYYPELTLVVVTGISIKAIKKWWNMIPGWES